jgi:putative flippase GtrA
VTRELAVPVGSGGLLLRYFVCGSVAVAVNVAVLTFSVEVLGIREILASCAGFLSAVVVNFWLQRRFTFRSNTPVGSGVVLFLAFATATLVLNLAVFSVLTHFVHYVAAQLIATLLMFLVNFQLNRKFTFRQ